MATPYAYLCDGCGHLASDHGLAGDGDLRAGPYRCEHCDCAIAQDAPMTGLTRRQFEATREGGGHAG